MHAGRSVTALAIVCIILTPVLVYALPALALSSRISRQEEAAERSQGLDDVLNEHSEAAPR